MHVHAEIFITENTMAFQERLKILVDRFSKGKHTVFAKDCGIPTSTFQNYITGERFPTREHLEKIHSKTLVNFNWLILGKGEPFIQEGGEAKTSEAGQMVPIDAAVQFLREEEEKAGVALIPAQRQSILKMLRKTLAQDRQNLNELIRSIGGKEDEGSR